VAGKAIETRAKKPRKKASWDLILGVVFDCGDRCALFQAKTEYL